MTTTMRSDWVDTPSGQVRIDTFVLDGNHLVHDIGDAQRLTRYGARCELQARGLDFDAAWQILDDLWRRYGP